MLTHGANRLPPTFVGSDDRLANARGHQYGNRPSGGAVKSSLAGLVKLRGAQLNHLAARGGEGE